MEVNGKTYPIWSQFVEKQDEWIGGTMEDYGDAMDKIVFDGISMKTIITGIELRPNGDDSAFFEVSGEDFSCGFDVQNGGIIGDEEGWITFRGYAGHQWRIKQKLEDNETV